MLLRFNPFGVKKKTGINGDGGSANIEVTKEWGMQIANRAVLNGFRGMVARNQGINGETRRSSLICTTQKPKRQMEYWKQSFTYRIMHARNLYSTTAEFFHVC